MLKSRAEHRAGNTSLRTSPLMKQSCKVPRHQDRNPLIAVESSQVIQARVIVPITLQSSYPYTAVLLPRTRAAFLTRYLPASRDLFWAVDHWMLGALCRIRSSGAVLAARLYWLRDSPSWTLDGES